MQRMKLNEPMKEAIFASYLPSFHEQSEAGNQSNSNEKFESISIVFTFYKR